MQSTENEVPGFCGGNSGFHSFEVAHFPYQNHVRVLTQSAAQSLFKAGGIGADFALNHDAFLMVMIKLYRVFDSNDMACAFGIDNIEHGCQSG